MATLLSSGTCLYFGEIILQDTVPKATDVPQWMTLVQQKLDSADTPRNVKLFLLRVMMNNARIFEPYAAHFVSTILTCLVDGTIGDKINYFFCDVVSFMSVVLFVCLFIFTFI